MNEDDFQQRMREELLVAISWARISKIIPAIPDPSQSPAKGALLGMLLPSVHLLALASVLDEALECYVEVKSIPWPESTRRDLYNRIEVVANNLASLDRSRLQELRKQRNRVAHTATLGESSITWAQLEDETLALLTAFVALGVLDKVPNIQAFFERNPTIYDEELGPDGELVRHEFVVGSKVDGQVCITYEHTIAYFPP